MMKNIKWKLDSLTKKQIKFDLAVVLFIALAVTMVLFCIPMLYWGIAVIVIFATFEYLFYKHNKYEYKFVEIIKKEVNQIIKEHNSIVRCEEKSEEKNVLRERSIQLMEIIENKYSVDNEFDRILGKNCKDDKSLIIIQQCNSACTNKWKNHEILKKINEINNKLKFVEWVNRLNKDYVSEVK